jgi:glycosyltransferase involved in cell wall biosynthesis
MSSYFNDRSFAKPRVSIGMPVYNGEIHVVKAIESVLSQTFSDFELIICDNASTDRTEEICREYAARDPRVRYHRNAGNLGASKNFSRTFELSRGEFFKWFAHDDILAPTYIERCIDKFEQSPPSVVLCFPQRVRISYEGQPCRYTDRRPWYEASPPYDWISFARLMRVPDRAIPGIEFGLVRRDVLAKTRLLLPVCYSDLILVAELRLLGEFREIPEPLYLNRAHRVSAKYRYGEQRTISEELKFYDPQTKVRTRTNAGALMALLKSRLGVVWSSSLPVHRRALFMLWIVFGHVVIRTLTPLDLKRLWLRRQVLGLWEFSSVQWIRRSEKNLRFHRLWVLLAGLRRRDQTLVSLAVAHPSNTTREKLRAYVTERLKLREDEHAKQLLTDWANRRTQSIEVAPEKRMRPPRREVDAPIV